MSNQEADDCAALIVEIFGVICRADAGTMRQSAAIVQLRSVELEPSEFEVPALSAAATN
jgi:hypothetical protein